MSIATASDFDPAPGRPIVVQFALAIACVVLADWLFYGWEAGISLALFFASLGGTAIAANRVHASERTIMVMSGVFVAGLLALAEDVNWLSVIWATFATAMFVIVLTAQDEASWRRQLLQTIAVPFRGPFQLAIDLFTTLKQTKRQLPASLRIGSLIAWIVPIGAFVVFLSLFASANPLIEYSLRNIDLSVLLKYFDFWRIVFWGAIACTIWPLIRRRLQKKRAPRPWIEGESIAPDTDDLLGAQAITRSLFLFNALFALQTCLDLTYLWGGLNLPAGMSHAEYAHRGAYPLIVTALLAASFVLIAMRPNGPADKSKLIRPLVLAFTAQNIMLVISSIFRLDIYVAAFSLTYLRLAALIWMILVAIGLLLMLVQILRRKSNSWLLTANAISLAVVLYGSSLLNTPWLVAYYNVEHCREVGGTGPSLDIKYLESLGSPQILPPLAAHANQFKYVPTVTRAWLTGPDRKKYSLPENWRAWGFRTWRLARYFANTAPERPES